MGEIEPGLGPGTAYGVWGENGAGDGVGYALLGAGQWRGWAAWWRVLGQELFEVARHARILPRFAAVDNSG